MKIIITSPSLNTNQNVSGISSVTQFIINRNTQNEYRHFELGKRDDESRNLFWFVRILKAYLKWGYLMFTQKDILIHFNFAFSRRSILRDSPLIMLARLFRKRMIIHLHAGEYLIHKKTPPWMKYILEFNLSAKNPKIVLSSLEEDVLKHKFKSNNIFVLPNCIELKEASEFNRTYAKNEMLILLFMGRISVNKGIEIIYQAFESLKHKSIRFRFIMAGKGPVEKLYVKKFKDLLGVDFEYKGAVSGDNKLELLKNCNVFLLPSYFEGLPMALLESMSFGLVPIVTNVGSIKYVINNEINGIIIHKHSSDEIVSAIEKLSEDKEYMQELSTNARKYIFHNYNPDSYITRLNEIYNYE
jgi:glycosyltransferase involved in cell wall biosynthesis